MNKVKLFFRRFLSLLMTLLMIPISIIVGLFTLGLIAIGSVVGAFWFTRRLKRAQREREGIVIDHQD